MNTTVKAKKIAVAGFIHETNSFAEHKASFDDFTRADGWPALTMGKEMLSSVVEYGLAVAGFIRRPPCV